MLTATYTLTYPYERTVGPVFGAFLAALREGRVLGARHADGRVRVPPAEHGPDGRPLVELVEVGPAATVVEVLGVPSPAAWHPYAAPFAWALLLLDGADEACLHAVEDPGVSGGDRLLARPRPEAKTWADVEFVRLDAATPSDRTAAASAGAVLPAPVRSMPAPFRIAYEHHAGEPLGRFLQALTRRTFLGSRCPACTRVYAPCRATCPTCGVRMGEDVTLPDTGVVTTFCVVNVRFPGQILEPPYVCAHVLLDGADVPLFQLLGGCPPAEVRAGLRVRARWADTPAPTLDSVLWFEP